MLQTNKKNLNLFRELSKNLCYISLQIHCRTLATNEWRLVRHKTGSL